MIEVKLSKKGTQYRGHHVPVNAPYVIENGVLYYVTDIDEVMNDDIVRVWVKCGDRECRCVTQYVKAKKNEALRAIRTYCVKRKGKLCPVQTVILNRDIRPLVPKDRKVGEYVYKAVYSKGDNPHATTDYYVTNGCTIGVRRYSELGYWAHLRGEDR